MRLCFDGFILDTGGRRLLRDGREVPVSPKAFQLLELLVSKRPDAVSKAAIQDAVWPSTHVVEANVANIVGEIRTALHDDRRHARYIRTVPRFGYAFIGDEAAPAESGPTLLLALGDVEYRLCSGINDLGRSKQEYRGLFDSPTVSRQHARIVVRGATATIEDLGSKNGTFVGQARISGPIELQDGDVVRLGSATAIFCCRACDGSTQTLSGERRRVAPK